MKKEKVNVKLTINKDVIERVEQGEDGWTRLVFKSPHPIPNDEKD